MTQPGEDLHELDAPSLDPGRDLEAPDADAYEQALPVDPAQVPTDARLPLEASEADAYEQTIDVEGLDEDYR